MYTAELARTTGYVLTVSSQTFQVPRGHILDPIIPEQGLVMLFAPRGMGKTFVALAIAYAVACGDSALRWKAPTPRVVLYLDGEMPGAVMQDRLARTVKGAEHKAPEGNFTLLTPDLVPDGLMPNLATPEGQAAPEPLLNGVALVVVDNLACLARAGRENEAGASCLFRAGYWPNGGQAALCSLSITLARAGTNAAPAPGRTCRTQLLSWPGPRTMNLLRGPDSSLN